ncbi:hypothetical protein CDAR_548851 [Caerostris darwini]|uniref:Uncharacterized protein n=1 Tax=Caerostris darwini TaxID=1538125 RepID=A0AAV4WIB5_9ARAC|nr:hypothetical protein CDAR_548851 [Caerostris darwini]
MRIWQWKQGWTPPGRGRECQPRSGVGGVHRQHGRPMEERAAILQTTHAHRPMGERPRADEESSTPRGKRRRFLGLLAGGTRAGSGGCLTTTPTPERNRR